MFNISNLYKTVYDGYYYTISHLPSLTTQSIEKNEQSIDSTVDSEGFTKLHIAVNGRNLRETIKLISQGADVNKYSTNKLACTPLHISASIGNVDITQYLLENSADTEARDSENHTPLQIAAYNGDLKIAELLVNHNADVNVRDSNNNPLLHFAVFQDSSALIKILMKGWLDILAVDSKGRTALQLSIEMNKTEILSTLMEFENINDTINARTTKYNFPLHMAVLAKNSEAVEILISNKARVDVLDNVIGITPLYIAVTNNLVKIATILIFKGKSNINFIKEGTNESLLDKAIAMGYAEMADTLIQGGADYDIHNLNNAVLTGKLEVIKVLIKSGVDLIQVNTQANNNPLYNAVVVKKDIQIVKILVENGIHIPKNFFKIEKKEYGLWKKYDRENRDNILQVVKIGELADKIWKGEDISKKIIIKEDFFDILSFRLKIYFSQNQMDCTAAKKVLVSKSYIKYLTFDLINFIIKTINDLDNISLQLKIYDSDFPSEKAHLLSNNYGLNSDHVEEVSHIGDSKTIN